MKNTNNNNSPKNGEAKSWGRHFSGKNFFINALISFIPAAFVIGVMRDMSEFEVVGAVPILLVWGGLMLAVGIIREKIKKYFNKTYAKKYEH